jgi:hypothetical protein
MDIEPAREDAQRDLLLPKHPQNDTDGSPVEMVHA